MGMGYPHPVIMGVPPSSLNGGYPLSARWGHPNPMGGAPHQEGWGYPLIGKDRVYPTSGLDGAKPAPPPTPLASVNRLKILPSPILRMRLKKRPVN